MGQAPLRWSSGVGGTARQIAPVPVVERCAGGAPTRRSREVGAPVARRGSPRGAGRRWRSAAPTSAASAAAPPRAGQSAASGRDRGVKAGRVAHHAERRRHRRGAARASGSTAGSAHGRGASERPARLARRRSLSATSAGADDALRAASCWPAGWRRAGRWQATSPQAHRPDRCCAPPRPPRCRPCGSARPAAPGSAATRGSMPAARQAARSAGKAPREVGAERLARVEEDRAGRRRSARPTARATTSRGASSARPCPP